MTRLAVELLYRTRERFPGKVAVVDRGREITFSALWEAAVELGFLLKETVSSKNVPIVINMDKSIQAVIAMIGVQLSGNIYIPFDEETPPKRRRRAYSSLGPFFVLDWEKNRYQLNGNPLELKGDGPGHPSAGARESVLLEGLKARNSLDPLYIIFTSGSTGEPKGVAISNLAVIDYITWAAGIYQVDSDEIIGSQAPFHFDNSVLDLYLTFACGCTLHLLTKEHFLFLPSLMDYLREHAITFLFFVPSILANITSLKLLDRCALPALRKLLFAGEAMPVAILKELRRKLPDTLLSNLYGPTEITVDAIYWIFGKNLEDLTHVPLGVPCRNTRILILDEQEGVVERPDEVGEICVGGSGVALGYWNNPGKTARAFIQNPEHTHYREIVYKTGDLGYRSSKDGLIYMVGRRDDQIKHLGYRIELGEIESALNRLSEVVRSSVIYLQEERAIIAFYSSRAGGRIRN